MSLLHIAALRRGWKTDGAEGVAVDEGEAIVTFLQALEHHLLSESRMWDERKKGTGSDFERGYCTARKESADRIYELLQRFKEQQQSAQNQRAALTGGPETKTTT